ncbi:type II toxin-antitoxin system RelE/ParE family toxin [Testudinibacter sp. TR-2022]|uniref:type II toxin-antitoxin system RelE/ParE family toxin n=1 Tax=Testudinibacter sp. TR-2022 TaxID=2585029 RepID=UPI0011192C06|nr:type II toxin-antitoxin system RelE/ParE family toxin [Testudinibacter sp. TR-2022]TNH06426.1 type II toxin-antitoxin system RelE/ParE family toxin [Pasteurellaceae bacterium Phil11]TNH22950.1 type II toxin-antitoxin system RelE/ParE family toxin [Testudinibacter sp. TR-2022]TNH27686.1 type II toxin-antitoxin system RelE/ParE family toxin [Testudinibacter sp. TR-2022]
MNGVSEEIIVKSSSYFKKWLRKLKNPLAKAKINLRIKNLLLGNLGDVKPIGDGLSELRIHEGQGYRVYIKSRSSLNPKTKKMVCTIIILLCGGDKSTQDEDIARAKWMSTSKEIKEFLNENQYD